MYVGEKDTATVFLTIPVRPFRPLLIEPKKRERLLLLNFSIPHEVYSWSDITQFYNINKNKTPQLEPKLKEQHIQLPSISLMRVCGAIQTFSHIVSSTMFTLIINSLMNSKVLYTAKFVNIIDDLFDVFNSCSFDEPKIFRKSLTDNSKHWIFLNESYEILTKLEIQNSKKKKNSHQRAKSGNNVAPDSPMFYSAIQMCITQQLLVAPTSRNFEMEACEFLTKCNDLCRINKNLI
ncbi:hypothetical protein AGLY_009300 [Aphis glycines]|uniref:Transposable element P transposase-like GTP-binding insertion domain-containing protein n=1 Tax=Aphis glycines TaxID=307491 RepID=A0A6G0TK84_APHGL|nr:hypothetical protein AGLY_009300 [Aphis glycines]